MTELKTLKDLNRVYTTDDETGECLDAVWISELKAEAIKWVKEIEGQTEGCKCETCGEAYINKDLELNYRCVDFIKHFFNITSEDLE